MIFLYLRTAYSLRVLGAWGDGENMDWLSLAWWAAWSGWAIRPAAVSMQYALPVSSRFADRCFVVLLILLVQDACQQNCRVSTRRRLIAACVNLHHLSVVPVFRHYILPPLLRNACVQSRKYWNEVCSPPSSTVPLSTPSFSPMFQF